jgi:hypothetical protein
MVALLANPLPASADGTPTSNPPYPTDDILIENATTHKCLGFSSVEVRQYGCDALAGSLTLHREGGIYGLDLWTIRPTWTSDESCLSYDQPMDDGLISEPVDAVRLYFEHCSSDPIHSSGQVFFIERPQIGGTFVPEGTYRIRAALGESHLCLEVKGGVDGQGDLDSTQDAQPLTMHYCQANQYHPSHNPDEAWLIR